MNKRTFTMIKPQAVSNGHAGAILKMIEEAGFKIIAWRYTRLNKEEAAKFYAIHKDRPFYQDLVSFMSSGPIHAAILEKENAVAAYRKLIGATNPAEAAAGTIRQLYASSTQTNAVHGSDSDENAALEASFFFSKREIYS